MKRKMALATMVSVALLAGVLASGCSSNDSWAEPIYFQNLFVYDGAVWNQITTNGGGGGVPGGANTQVQYNDAGAFGGDAGLTYVEATNQLTVAGDFYPQQDVYVGNNLNVVNDLDVDDDVNIDGDLVVDGTSTLYNRLLFASNAIMWEDLRTPVTAVRLSGTKPPTWTSYQSSEVLGFSDQAVALNEEQIFFSLQLPHSYLEESDIYPHVHWVPEDGTGGNVRWQLTYTWANIDGTFGAATPDNINAPAGIVANKHLMSSFAAIDGTGQTISSMLLCSLKRNSSNALDTYDGKSAYFIEIDFHYQADTVGSRTETAK